MYIIPAVTEPYFETWQPAITCSRLAIETLEQDVKYVQGSQ